MSNTPMDAGTQAALDVKKMTRDRINASYPEHLRKIEYAAITKRRRKAGLVGPSQEEDEFPKDSIGLAISGGGIRSATTGLGFLQALAKQRVKSDYIETVEEAAPPLDKDDTKLGVPLLRRIDYLSTVSGGGYIGSFWGRHYLRGDDFSKDKPVTLHTEALLTNHWSAPVYWLRENGRYLTPAGGADYWIAVANWLRNFLMVQILVGAALLMAIFGLLATKGAFYAAADCEYETGAAIRPLSKEPEFQSSAVKRLIANTQAMCDDHRLRVNLEANHSAIWDKCTAGTITITIGASSVSTCASLASPSPAVSAPPQTKASVRPHKSTAQIKGFLRWIWHL